MTGHLYRLAFVWGSIAAIAASAACGGGGSGSASPTTAGVTAVATPSIVAASTVAARVATPAVVATETQPAAAPTATAVPQGSGDPPPLPTAARATPTSPAPAPPPPPPPPPSEESLTIVAKDVQFASTSLTAHAGSVLHVTLDNQDAGVPHDIIVYDASGAVVAGTSPENGPVQQMLTVTLGAPQRYTFKCSVHPLTMNGVITVQ